MSSVDTIDVEGVLLTVRDLDALVYGLRELPERLRGLGEQAFHSGYLAAIRAKDGDVATIGREARSFGDAVASVSAEVLHNATRGLTSDERENPYANGLR